MKALYTCSDKKCNKQKEVNSIGNQAHFKRCACECGRPMVFKKLKDKEE